MIVVNSKQRDFDSCGSSAEEDRFCVCRRYPAADLGNQSSDGNAEKSVVSYETGLGYS